MRYLIFLAGVGIGLVVAMGCEYWDIAHPSEKFRAMVCK